LTLNGQSQPFVLRGRYAVINLASGAYSGQLSP
jgi:hypothetical protein